MQTAAPTSSRCGARAATGPYIQRCPIENMLARWKSMSGTAEAKQLNLTPQIKPLAFEICWVDTEITITTPSQVTLHSFERGHLHLLTSYSLLCSDFPI